MPRSLTDMNSNRSLSLDLVQADLADPSALVQLVADHALAPARRAWSLPSPVGGEEPLDVQHLPVQVGDRFDWQGPVPKLRTSTALFDPLVRGFVLFTKLFPGAILTYETATSVTSVPNWIYFEHSRQMASFLWSDLEHLVAGILGGPPRTYRSPALESRIRTGPNPEALAELAEAQQLVRDAIATPSRPEPPLANRYDIGLRSMKPEAVFALDDVLRADAHQRAVWFARVDLLFPLGEMATAADGSLVLVEPTDDRPVEQVDDHGVYPTVVAETIRGVVALDLVSTFSRERTVGQCDHCQAPVILTGHQIGRVDRGEPVFHSDCHPEHRRRWMRDYQRSRRADRRAATRPSGGDQR
jgi:hypothetical protein